MKLGPLRQIHAFTALAIILLGCLTYRASIAAIPNQELSVNTGYFDVVRLIGKREYVRAIELGISLVKQNSEQRFELFERLAHAAKSSGKLEETEKELERLLLQNQTNARLSYGLALLQLESGNQQQQAMSSLRECVSRLPNEPLPLLSLIRAHHRLDQIAAAEGFIAELLQQNPDNAAAHLGKAIHLSLLKDDLRAIGEAETAVRLAPAMPQACFHYAQFLFQADRLKESIDAAKLCLQITNEPEQEIRRDLLLRLGTSQAMLGDYEIATETLSSARALSKILEDLRGEQAILSSLGSIHWAQDFYSEALSEYQQALELAVALSDRFNEGITMANLGSLHVAMGNYGAADKALKESLAIISAFPGNEIHKANIWARTGILQTEQGLFAQAIQSYNESLKYEELRKPLPPQASTFNALAGLYLKTSDYLRAREMIIQAQSLDSQQMLETGLITLALSGELNFRLGDLINAEDDFQRLYRRTKDGSNPHHLWKACAGLASVYEKQKRLEESNRFYHLAIEIMESVRVRLIAGEGRTLFFQNKVETYQRLVSVLMKLKKHSSAEGNLVAAKAYAAKAFDISERARARSLLDSLSKTTRTLDQEIPQDLKIQRWQIQARFSQIESKLRKSNSEQPINAERVKALTEDLKRAAEAFNQWQVRLQQRSPRYARLQYPEPLTLEQVQQMLRNN